MNDTCPSKITGYCRLCAKGLPHATTPGPCVYLGKRLHPPEAPDNVRHYAHCAKLNKVVCTCRECNGCTLRMTEDQVENATPLLLTNDLAPGDVTVMTAAVDCLHRQHPHKFLTWVRTTAPALWENNPHVEPGEPDAKARRIRMEYPLIDRSNQEPRHFLEGYVEFLGKTLGVPLRLDRSTPALYVSDAEKGWIPQVHETHGPIRYWVVNAGVKRDFTAKAWGRANYQALVDSLKGAVTFVQIGEAGHDHPALDGVIDLRGQTDTRQLVRLVHHADGGVGPTTFLQHLCAGLGKPYVCLLGGREPVSWVQYPLQTTLHSIGALPCCRGGACWRSRTVALGDGDKNDGSLCDSPVGADPIPRCMAMIGVEEVRAAIMRHVHGAG